MRINISYNSSVFIDKMNSIFVGFDSICRIKDICPRIIGLIPFWDIY